jgi:ribonucleotide reductase class II
MVSKASITPFKLSDYSSYIHKSRYARWLPEQGRREHWNETVHRYVNYFTPHIPKVDREATAKEIEEAILHMEVMPSMRAMMTAGPALEKDNCAGYNCSYIAVDDPRAFDEAMYISMCGTGVGFSVERQYVNQMPIIAENFYETDTVIKVKDNKIGWASAFRQLISLLYGGLIPKWDLSAIRPSGAPLKTMGGRASGPEPLDQLFKFTVNLFQKAAGRKLNSLESHDLMCTVADIVVVGGVRRSAMLSLSNLSDERMRNAKNGQWWNEYGYRRLANNSVAYTEKPEPEIFIKEFLTLIESKSGERGIFNRVAAQNWAKRSGRRKWENVEFGCNPSLRKGTRVWTTDGVFPIELLEGKEFIVRNLHGQESPAKCWLSGTGKQLWKVCLTGGIEYFSTAEHKWPVVTKSGVVKTETKDLKRGAYLPLSAPQASLTNGTLGDYEDGFVVGWNLGDGWITERSDGKQIGFIVNDEDRKHGIDVRLEAYLQERCAWAGSLQDKSEINVNNLKLKGIFRQFDVRHKSFGLPSVVWTTASEKFRRGLIDGLFSSDGCGGERCITLTTAHRQLAMDVSDLLGFYGIKSRIKYHAVAAHAASFPNGQSYDRTYDRFEVVVDQSFLPVFSGLLKLTHSGKQGKIDKAVRALKRPLLQEGIRVVSVEPTELFEDVWDIAVFDDTHCFQLAHCVTGNCGEINLRSKGFCNLSEVVVRPNDTKAIIRKKIRTATIIGCLQSTLTDFRYLRKEWQKNAEEERLLGVSLTGIMDNKLMSTNGLELGKLLDEFREYTVEVATEWAGKLGINMPAAITCVKPSGTVSQLVDSSSGIHTRFSRWINRAVREDRKSPVSAFLKSLGVPCEPEAMKPNDVDVFYFPLEAPATSVCRNDLNAIQQLELYLTYKMHWTEHNPSCTIYVKEPEWTDVLAWVFKHFDIIGGVSFLPHSDHAYRQAPYQEVTKEQYYEALEKMPAIDWSLLQELEDTTISARELACSAGACELSL